MEFRRGSKRVRLNYHQINKRLSKTIRETDAGVIIQDSHSPKQHIIRTTTVNNPVGNTNTAFSYRDEEVRKKLVISFVQPKLEKSRCSMIEKRKKEKKTEKKVKRLRESRPAACI